MLAFGDGNGPLAQVAILGFPAVRMADHDAIAAFTALNGRCGFIRETDVGHAVAQAGDGAGGGGDYGNAFGHMFAGGQGEISAFVALVAEGLALVISNAGGGIKVHVLLDVAVRAGQITVDGRVNQKPLRQCRTGEGDKQGKYRPFDHSAVSRGGLSPES